MWNKPYTLKEGTAIVLGLLFTGGLLQVAIGPLEWRIFAWPANIIALILLIIALVAVYVLRNRFYICRFMTTMQAAIPSIAASVALTLIMGITKQVAEGKDPIGPNWIDQNA